ncbi:MULTISPECIES: hypothetical protein [Thalassobaculum]|uniref:Uncharacterized protein n=1 Tax=Thalassobaculum litoreum DSM 18839 TaxID=1123362 RepID=A0A8G2BH88_9PROT|nr:MULTISPECIES: hypothetical protein [Thalassobaculum]SDF65319.1 hypothetical protein SAMN05660686_01929 [Thalassobaculum litoreum DSM 18839]
MATYQSYYKVKYHDEFQVRWSVEQQQAASEMAGRPTHAVSGTVGAVYGGVIAGTDADADRRG